MDHESETTSVAIENLKHSLHRDIQSAIRDNIKSIVKNAVTEAIDDNLPTLKADNAKLSKENKALKKRVKSWKPLWTTLSSTAGGNAFGFLTY